MAPSASRARCRRASALACSTTERDAGRARALRPAGTFAPRSAERLPEAGLLAAARERHADIDDREAGVTQRAERGVVDRRLDQDDLLGLQRRTRRNSDGT